MFKSTFSILLLAALSLAAAPRTVDEVEKDLGAQLKDLTEIYIPRDAIANPAKRKEAAPRAIPIIKKMVPLFDELSALDPSRREQVQFGKSQYLANAAFLGDKESLDVLTRASESKNTDESRPALAGLLILDWFKAGLDADARIKVLDKLDAAVKMDPRSDALAAVIGVTVNSIDDPKLRDRAEEVNNTRFKAAGELLKSMVGKPLTLTGKTLDKKDFSTADWKGKVVLVDFWATWCPPCVEGMPKVKKMYEQYHEKGLEIVGVSSDERAAMLRMFVKDNAIPWPQLFDPSAQDMHPLNRQLGIVGIPTLFLIDKKGVLRSTSAREEMEELVPKLLGE
jgi:thiol-disulfide isomerase/thioredoxin